MSGISKARTLFQGGLNGWMQRFMAKRLEAAGLKYDDLLIEYPDVKQAIERLDPDVKIERERRIKRAFDGSAKRKAMPAGTMEGDVFDSYLQPKIFEALADRQEKDLYKYK